MWLLSYEPDKSNKNLLDHTKYDTTAISLILNGQYFNNYTLVLIRRTANLEDGHYVLRSPQCRFLNNLSGTYDYPKREKIVSYYKARRY
jgi:hypothetical protein